MANLRVVYDNAAERATIVASSTAGTLTTANLKSDFKSEVWRSTASTATLTLTWATAEMIGMVGLAFASLTSAAQFRVRAYTLSTDATPIYDVTGPACAAADFDKFFWGSEPLGVNAYSYGGAAYGVRWIAPGTYQKIVIDISDSNPLGYIEGSKLLAGTYWSPAYTAEAGASVGIIDNSKQERTDAGDLRTDRGTVNKAMSFDLNFLTTADRNTLWNILRGNGLFKPVFVSLVPESTEDPTGEQIYQIYGKMTKPGSIKYAMQNMFTTQLDLEEV